jgi:hypothetical protein
MRQGPVAPPIADPMPAMRRWASYATYVTGCIELREVRMPEYQHSCFISYKHPPALSVADVSRHFWMEFITSFQERLESFRRIGLAAYRDDQLQSVPGTRYPQELSRRFCRSVCLIAILVPEYLESSWCRAEWNQAPLTGYDFRAGGL